MLVELADTDGVRVIGNLLGPADQEVTIGDAVEAVFEDHEGGYTLVQWRADLRAAEPRSRYFAATIAVASTSIR